MILRENRQLLQQNCAGRVMTSPGPVQDYWEILIRFEGKLAGMGRPRHIWCAHTAQIMSVTQGKVRYN